MVAANQAPTILDYAQQLIAGTSAILALSFGGSPTASNRTGLYGDLTAAAEKVCLVVGGQTGPIFTRNGSVVDATFSGAVTITGNLTVNGTTSTINSTTVDVQDRVIRVNKTTGANDPVPSAIAGLSVHRGTIASVARDTYGLFWDESATKWKLAVNTGADDATLGAYLNLQLLGLTAATASFSGQITSTLATGTAPLVIASATLVSNLYVARSALADTVTTNANLTGPITSSGNATALAAQTGTGSVFVVQNTPTLTTPVLGAATGTSIALGAAALATYGESTTTPAMQATGTGGSAASFGIARFVSAAANSPTLYQARSRGTTVGDYTAVQAADSLGINNFQGSDNTDFSSAAVYEALVDTGATVSAGVVPGRLRARTANSAGTMTTGWALDSNQVLIVGTTTIAGQTIYDSAGVTPLLQVISSSSSMSTTASIAHFRANTTGPTLSFLKSRSSTIGTMTVVNANDALGNLDFGGADGTNGVVGARIRAIATGTPASTRVAASLLFQTGTDAAPTVLTTAVTITNAQAVSIDVGIFTTSNTTDASAIGTASVVHVGGVSIAKKTYHGDDLVFSSAADFVFDAAGSGSKLGTATSQKIGLWNAAPVIQYATTGTVTGFTANTTTAVLDGSTFTGNTGSAAYTIGDIVRALKLCGVMAA